MPSFTLHDPTANLANFVSTTVRDYAYASLKTTPDAPSGNRGPGNADNRIVITEISMDVGGYDQASNVHYGVWTSNGQTNLYISPRIDAPKVGGTSNVPPLPYLLPLSGEYSNLALSGGTSYYFGVHNPGVNGMTVQRTSGATGYLGRDSSHGDDPANPLTGSFDPTKYPNSTLIGTVSYIYLPSKPATISAIGGKNQIQVSWTAPADDGGTAITNYIPYWKKSSDASWSSPIGGFLGTGLSYTITGLEDSTSYDVRVAASTTDTYDTLTKTGEYSDTATVTTAPRGPSVWTGTSWTFTEGFVCTSAGTWTAAAPADIYVCTSVSPSVVWAPIP